jgi:tetratricopeptide (TPR) repeat protein
MGDAAYAAGDNPQALKYYRQALDLDPEDPQGHYNLAEMYYDTDDLSGAETECREALRLDPGFAYAYLTLGNIYLDQEEPHKALHSFQEFLLRERSDASREIRTEVAALIEGLEAEL